MSVRQGNASNEAYVLLLPGKQLDVSQLVNKKKKFRTRIGRDGALSAMSNLETNGIGSLVLKASKGSVKVGLQKKLKMVHVSNKMCTCLCTN